MILVEKIVEKFKDVLTEEDLSSFKSQLSDLISEESKKRSDLIIEEKTKDLQAASEKYISEAKEEIKGELTKDYDLKLEQLEEKLVATIDQLIDLEISKNISDEYITKIAINETLEPLVSGIKKLFSDNLIDLDVEGTGVVKKLQTENALLTKQLSESIAEKITIAEDKKVILEKLEKISVASFIKDKVEGLKDVQKERIVKLFEDKKFDDVEKQIDSMIDLVIKEENKPEDKPETVVDGDGIVPEKKTIVNENSVVELAKRLI